VELTRRALLRAAASAAALAALPSCGTRRAIGGRIVGGNAERGHRLRGAGGAPASTPASTESVEVAIVGGGVAGLSAAWKLAKAGVTDVVLLELEDALGGTAASGESRVSRYPWAAHYVPLPTREQRTLCELLAEAGVVRGFDARGHAVASEESLCRAPEERLFHEGEWREGLYPRAGASADDLRQLDRFQADVDALASRRDAAGRRAFAIPTARSARDADLVALDAVSMDAWMRSRGYDSPRLRWFVEYACRDDFGCLLEGTSAWAALHYFASRIAAAGEEPAPFLTWPEGNDFLARRLARSVEGRARTGAVVLEVAPASGGAAVRWFDAKTNVLRETRARRVVCALPRFLARRVVRGLEAERGGFATTPWVVANLTLDGPVASRGFPTAWDNVVHGSESLGYVVATHQTDRRDRDAVWTWYRPFPGPDPASARERILATPWEGWRDAVLADLAPAHEGLEERLVSVDVWRWGHGMVRPEPGFLFGEARAAAARPLGPVHFAAADLGGLPLFEEAQWAGVRAAEEVLAALGVPFESSL
jgi:glycine/D-amino acid oxidase-like deaminating enzyme